MATVNLSKALKMKNVLVGEINRAKEIFTRENSRSELSTSKVDRAAVYADIQAKTKALVSLKAAIAKANVGILRAVAEVSATGICAQYADGVRSESPRFAAPAGDEVRRVLHAREGGRRSCEDSEAC